MRKWLFWLGILAVAAVAVLLFWLPNKQPVVAIVNLGSHPILDASVAGIKQGLTEGGYPGDRIRIVESSANMDMNVLGALVREALLAKPDVLVSVSTPVTRAVLAVPRGSDQRLVYSTVTNPADVRADTVGNLTGVADVVNYEANLRLIKALFPTARTVGMVYNPGESNSQFGVDQVRRLTGRYGLELVTVPITSSNEVADAVTSLMGRIDVLYVGSDNTVVSGISAVTSVAYGRRVPVISSDEGSVREGALAAVSVDYVAVGKAAGNIVARLLDSGDPAGTVAPVRLVGNTLILSDRAARQIGYTFSDSIRQAAGHVVPAN